MVEGFRVLGLGVSGPRVQVRKVYFLGSTCSKGYGILGSILGSCDSWKP